MTGIISPIFSRSNVVRTFKDESGLSFKFISYSEKYIGVLYLSDLPSSTFIQIFKSLVVLQIERQQAEDYPKTLREILP